MARPEETFTLRPAADDGAETLAPWGWQFVMPAGVYADEPVRESVKAMQVTEAHRAAEKDGYELVGDPVRVDEDPAVWLPEMAEGRGGLVGLDLARRIGYNGEPTHYLYSYEWGARKKPPRRLQRKDIDDQHVIDLAQQWADAPGPGHHPGVVLALVAEGIPEKLALSKVEHLSDRDYPDYGTTPYFSWPTGKQLPQ